MINPIVQVNHLNHYYSKFHVLKNISFEVQKGDIVGFLGPNGAGKTTTMRILTGFMPPTSGSVFIDGTDVFDDPVQAKMKIGYLPEIPPLYPELTVTEYLSLVTEIKKVPKKERKEKIGLAIERTGLEQRRNTLISFLSKGLKQRVGIAQAIVNSPSLLILDEPTVGLDPKQVVEIRNLITGLAKEEERTVILSTHLLAEAGQICNKALIIQNGELKAEDSVDHLIERSTGLQRIRLMISKPPDDFPKQIRESVNISHMEETSPQQWLITAEQDIREELVNTVIKTGAGLLEIYKEKDTLENTFLKLTSEEENETVENIL